ncbi:hypothetical protein Lal_00031780 [Lupinus albus]|nr:hypothetical protein Lal_00031780 [Lupinus albus]
MPFLAQARQLSLRRESSNIAQDFTLPKFGSLHQLGQKTKHWVKLYFGVKGRRMRPIMGHTMHYKRMIITLQPGYSIPPLRKKRT